MLGESGDFFSGGELRYIWDRGLQWRYLCGCGRELPVCPVWSAVVEQAFGSRFEADRQAEELTEARFQVMRSFRIAGNLRRTAPGPFGWAPLDNYTSTMKQLYHAIGDVTGASVVVDSSKFAQDAAVLRLVDGVDPYFVHLVRDVRGVAYSNLRVRNSVPDPNRRVEMERMTPTRSALRWSRFNIAADLVRARTGRHRSMLLRYEDLIESPRRSLQTIFSLAQAKEDLGMFVDEHTIRRGGNHTVWGNPIRFQQGESTLKLDDEWRSRLGTIDRLKTTALALPLLLRYGYLPFSSRVDERAGE
jgi:hypothetical protein